MNTMHLYGNIVDVFEGKTNPQSLTKSAAGIAESLSFGLGVSCFQDDLSNIGDAAFFNQRFFIRSTDESQRRDLLKRPFKEDKAQNYRTIYSLGTETHPMRMKQKKLLSEPSCKAGFTIEDLISRIIGPPRQPGDAPRTFGFLGLVDYDRIYSTSLSVAPIHGENIIPHMKKYARESHPPKESSGAVMGFVRDRIQSWDDEQSKSLSMRLFFDNPKDNERPAKANARDHDSLRGPHWISHTHGLRLSSGKSIFPRDASQNDEELFRKMCADESFCTSIIDQCLDRNDWDDCGHIIPRSTLRRSFVVTFPIHTIEPSK